MATPTFWTEYLANTDIISGASSTKTQIANVTAAWGDATKANVNAAADCVWPARSDVWTGASFTIVLVAQPIDVYDNSDPYTVFTLVSATSHILEVAFFGNHQSGTVGTDALNVYAYQGGAYRVGFAADNQCDGNAHTWVIRFNAGTMHCWRDGVAQTITPTNVNTIAVTGNVTPHINSDGTGIGHINRNAPVGLVKFFNSALSDAEVATESFSPWYSAGGSTNATGTGALPYVTLSVPTGSAIGTGGATNGTGAGALQSVALTAPAGSGVGTSAGLGTITTPVLKNNTGTVLANETGVTVNIYNTSTGALIVQKTGQTSNASGIVTISDALIVSGTSYAYEVVLTGSRRRLPIGLAA